MEGNINEDVILYLLSSIKHEKYLPKVKKWTLSLFDDKHCYTSNSESKPWN